MKSWRFLLTVAILILGISSMGCKSTYMTSDPYTLYPCAWQKTEDPKVRAMGALLIAMKDNRWTIVQGSAEQGFVRARACRHTYCISVDAFVDSGGTVQCFRSPDQYLDRDGGRLLEGWMHKLTRRFEDYKCDPPPRHLDLVEELSMPAGSVPVKPGS